MKKVLLLALIFVAMTVSVSFANTITLHTNTNPYVGTIEPGKDGWAYPANKVELVTITCNATGPWQLTVSVPGDIADGLVNFTKTNLKFEVYYFGHALAAAPFWTAAQTGYDHIVSRLNNYFTGDGMVLCRSTGTAPLENPFVSGDFVVVIAITAGVPGGGSNLTGSYAGQVQFNITDTDPN